MDPMLRTRLRNQLLHSIGDPVVTEREQIRAWGLSGLERLRLGRGGSVVMKCASAPFLNEHNILMWLQRQGVPVPALRASFLEDGTLGMLLDDIGRPARQPTLQDVAVAAVAIHQARPPAWLDPLDAVALAVMPACAQVHLDRLQAIGRFPDSTTIREHLNALAQVATERAAGAETAPFGMCHGALRPSTVHIGTAKQWWVLDVAMALHGPGLLDLAAWSRSGHAADPVQTRRLVKLYVGAGGHSDALANRAGLPAEYWALGWHQVRSAHWLLHCAAKGIHGPDSDEYHLHVLRRQLTSARQLLDVA